MHKVCLLSTVKRNSQVDWHVAIEITRVHLAAGKGNVGAFSSNPV